MEPRSIKNTNVNGFLSGRKAEVKGSSCKKNLAKLIFPLLASLILNFFVQRNSIAQTPVPTGLREKPESNSGQTSPSATDLAFLEKRKKLISEALEREPPVIRLQSSSTVQQEAEAISLADPNFTYYSKDSKGSKYLSEIFGVYPVRAGDFAGAEHIEPDKVFRVEMYNFALNTTTVAIVDRFAKKVLKVDHLLQTQADIPITLKELAIQIATNSKEVADALGSQPLKDSALMASTKTSLNKTRCERSRHLCVAPTFVKEDRALWAIVDLTDLEIAGIRWTNVGSTGPALVTERSIENERITAEFCDKNTVLEKNGWKLSYRLTISDGLEIVSASFKGKPVLDSAKLVDWHVSYSNTDGFGYSDAIGCPVFSQAAVIAREAPKIQELNSVPGEKSGGFIIEQPYFNQAWPTPCNYNYIQRYEFHSDGRFRVSAASVGRGCGNDGTYRPVFRIAFANTKSFGEFDGKGWSTWGKEGWRRQEPETRYTKEGYQFKITGMNGSYFLEPSRGQFADRGRGDFAFTYVTRTKPGEGDSNLITIGPCCNSDYRQGPEKFIEPIPEAINNGSFVVWYVPEMKNDDRIGQEYCWAESVLVNGVYQAKTYPCYAGPMFVPEFSK
jgi:hypothetical protein